MKMSDAKPCASCGGALCVSKRMDTKQQHWYVIRVSMAMINPRAANAVLGLMHVMGGSPKAFGIAEVMSPDADNAILIAGEKDPNLYTNAHVCFDCAMTKPLLELLESIHGREEAEAEAHGTPEAVEG